MVSFLGGLFKNDSSQLTLIISEQDGYTINEAYGAAEMYLSTRITTSIGQLKVSKAPREKSLSVIVNKGQKVIDMFEGTQLEWEFICTETQSLVVDYETVTHTREKTEHRSCVLDRAKCIRNESKVVKLFSVGNIVGDYNGGPWRSANLDHPSTFDTLAMDSILKMELMDDLDRFVKRKDFYRRVGRPWKRGYLLYGPPGTGKSSLIAAMANYLKFDVYDLELAILHSNSELRRLLTETENRSILVIEDIDCSVKLQDRQYGGHSNGNSELTLSGLLNFIDGLWSSCGDERILVFTTNYKDRIDPALLRPGRTDMHIHLSYCTPCGFRTLASNYLNVKTHCLFPDVEQLIKEVSVTSAEVAEELMKGEDVDIVPNGLIGFLRGKKKLMESKEEADGK